MPAFIWVGGSRRLFLISVKKLRCSLHFSDFTGFLPFFLQYILKAEMVSHLRSNPFFSYWVFPTLKNSMAPPTTDFSHNWCSFLWLGGHFLDFKCPFGRCDLSKGIWDRKHNPPQACLNKKRGLVDSYSALWCHGTLGHRRYWIRKHSHLFSETTWTCLAFISASLHICILSLPLPHLTISYSSVFSKGSNPAWPCLSL